MPGRLLPCALLLALACAPAQDGAREAVDVYVAASLREAVAELAREFEREHEVELRLNSGGSGWLAIQIERGAQAEVYLSAGLEEVRRLEQGGHLAPSSARELCANQLVLVRPRGAAPVSAWTQLLDPGPERLALADPDAVPAGRYARAWLSALGRWEALSPRVLRATHVRAALAFVESGAAELGVVYATDAARSERVEVAHRAPLDEAVRVRYWGALCAEAEANETASAFLHTLSGERGRSVLRAHGFLAATGR